MMARCRARCANGRKRIAPLEDLKLAGEEIARLCGSSKNPDEAVVEDALVPAGGDIGQRSLQISRDHDVGNVRRIEHGLGRNLLRMPHGQGHHRLRVPEVELGTCEEH